MPLADPIDRFFTITGDIRDHYLMEIREVPRHKLAPLLAEWFPPVAAVQEVKLRLRDDVASEPDQREGNMQSAPAKERGLFLVPKVIE